MEPRLVIEVLAQYLERQPETVKLRIRLYMALRTAILDRVLKQGTKLPPTRLLADELDMGRNTVVRAYEQLLVEGYLEGRVGDGTYVSGIVDSASKPDTPKRLIGTRREGLSRRGTSIASQAASSAIQHGAFMPGVPAVDLFPFNLWRRLVGKYIHADQSRLLNYTHLGFGPLKVALANYLRVTRMMTVDPKQVLIINGSHQGFDLCARMLADHGDRVWIEDPGYWGARNVLHAAGLDVRPIPLDAKGLAPTPEDWAQPPRMIFTSPSSQYPTGVVLSLDRRLELLENAHQSGSWIIEDDYDNELRYDERPVASLFGLCRRQRVIYMGTFSKVMYPGIRLAYMVLPEDLVDAFVIGNSELYRGGRMPEQAALAEFIDEGYFTAHIKRMRGIYQGRRDALREAMESRLGDVVTVSGGHAGLQLVYRFNRPIDDTLVAAQALAKGVVSRPLSMYYANPESWQTGLNLGFAAVPEKSIVPAVETLVRVIESHL
ncbi:PLP-dependent aminotransferase family protein [Propionivibrio limicola]|uniref:MocR-like pyridoxine biosynthesis transcription factor PdxR n=1 Tax=Propionivibrio limicola TaxID=167645 RepID=UPI001292033E|nr:PLP-dependent aminotransferase family protein [Propionivibrio limicola]